MAADDDVQEAPRAWSVAIHTKDGVPTQDGGFSMTLALEFDPRSIKTPTCLNGRQSMEHRRGALPPAVLSSTQRSSSLEHTTSKAADMKPEVERAAQRVMLMRMAQPALMPNPHCLDAPPPGMMQRCHRKSVVQFINEVRYPRPRPLLSPLPHAPHPARHV